MTEIPMIQTGGEGQAGGFEHSDFEFISDFVLWISDFLSFRFWTCLSTGKQ
jgi:hypothetical protein